MGCTEDVSAAVKDAQPSCLDLSSDYIKLKISFLDADVAKNLMSKVVTALQQHEAIQEHLAQGIRDSKQYTKQKLLQVADASDDTRGRIEFLESRIILLEKQLHTLAQNIEGGDLPSANASKVIAQEIAKNTENEVSIDVSDSEDEGNEKPVAKKKQIPYVPSFDDSRRFSLSSVGKDGPEVQVERTTPKTTMNTNVIIEERTLDLGSGSRKNSDKAHPQIGKEEDMSARSLGSEKSIKSGRKTSNTTPRKGEAPSKLKSQVLSARLSESSGVPEEQIERPEAQHEGKKGIEPEDAVEFEIMSPREETSLPGEEGGTGIKVRVSPEEIRRLNSAREEGSRPTTAPEPGSEPSKSARKTQSAEDTTTKSAPVPTAEDTKSKPALVSKVSKGGSRGSENPRMRWHAGIDKVLDTVKRQTIKGVLQLPVEVGKSLLDRVLKLEELVHDLEQEKENSEDKKDEDQVLESSSVLSKMDSLGMEMQQEVESLKDTVGKSLAHSSKVDEIIADTIPMLTKRIEQTEKKMASLNSLDEMRESLAKHADQFIKLQERMDMIQTELRQEAVRRRNSVKGFGVATPAQMDRQSGSSMNLLQVPPLQDQQHMMSPRSSKKDSVGSLSVDIKKLEEQSDGTLGLTDDEKERINQIAINAEQAVAFREVHEDTLVQRAIQLRGRVEASMIKAESILSAVIDLTKNTKQDAQQKDAVPILVKTDLDLRGPLSDMHILYRDVAAQRMEDSILRLYLKRFGDEIKGNDLYDPFVEGLAKTEPALQKITNFLAAIQDALSEHNKVLGKICLSYLQIMGAMQSKESMMRLHSQLMERLDVVAKMVENCVNNEQFDRVQDKVQEDINRVSNMLGGHNVALDQFNAGLVNGIARTQMLENRMGELESQVNTTATKKPALERPPKPVDMAKVNEQIKQEVAKMVDLFSKKQNAEGAESVRAADSEEIKKIQDELEFTIQKVEGLFATKADIALVEQKASKQDLTAKADKATVRQLEQFFLTLGEDLKAQKGHTEKALQKLRAQSEAQLLNALEEHFSHDAQVPSAIAKHNAWLCMSCQRPASAAGHALPDSGVKNNSNVPMNYPDVLRAGFRMPLNPTNAHISPREHGLRPVTTGPGLRGSLSAAGMMSRSTEEFEFLGKLGSGSATLGTPSSGMARMNSGSNHSAGTLSIGRPNKKKKNPRKDISGSWLQVDRIKPGPLFQIDHASNQRSDDLAKQVEKLNNKLLKEI